MCRAGEGSIINVSSIAGLVAAHGAFAYSTSKWAVRGMTKTAAVELARSGVRVNSIHPGMIETDMLHQVPGYADSERMTRLFTVATNPMHRALLMTAHAAGLRASELTRLRISDIDSGRMALRVDQGKGSKDRYVPLSPRLLA